MTLSFDQAAVLLGSAVLIGSIMIVGMSVLIYEYRDRSSLARLLHDFIAILRDAHQRGHSIS